MRKFVLGVMILWVWGCATFSLSPPPSEWQCPVEADAAVGQGDWKSALELHQVIVNQAPQNCLAIYHLGYISGKLGDRATEAAQYERSVACGNDRDPQLLFNLGMAYGELDRLRDAVTAFERAVALAPANADNHFGLGLMLRDTGQMNQAKSSFARALVADGRHWEARLALCRILLDQGHLKAARQHLKVLSNEMPDNEQVDQLWRIYKRRRAVLDE